MSLLSIPDELIALRDSVRAFLDREVRPIEETHAKEIHDTGTIAHDRALAERRRIRKKSVAAGYYAMHLPDDMGGMGLSLLGSALVREAIGASGLILAERGAVVADAEGPMPVLAALDAEQRARYLEPLVRGEIETCFALSEPGAGSDATRIATRARKVDGGWVVNGHKHFITNGQHADVIQLFAATDSGDGRAGITFFLVDADTDGVTVARQMRTVGADLPAELVFTDVFVPDRNVVGDPGQGFRSAMGWINEGRVNIAASVTGSAQLLVDRMVTYARQRETFGRPIGHYQFVQEHIVSSAVEVRMVRPLVYEAAHAVDTGDAEARQLAAMAKLAATEMAGRVADRAMQVFGGAGIDVSTGLERYWRDLRASRVYEGTSEILKLTVAKTLGLT
jgi:alkylation response protein AidB-like acyl-CoA dehydrogenase